MNASPFFQNHPSLSAVVILLGITALCPVKAFAKTEYLALFFEGARMGYVIGDIIEEEDHIVEHSQVHMELRRDRATVSMDMDYTLTRHVDGRLRTLHSDIQLGALPMRMHGQVDEENRLNVTVQTGLLTQERHIPLPKNLMTEQQLIDALKQQAFAPGARVESVILEPTSLEFLQCTLEVVGPTTIDVLGKREKVMHIIQTVQAPTSPLAAMMKLPGSELRGDLYLSSDFRLRKMVESVMGMHIEAVACSREFALAAFKAPEAMAQTFIRCPRPLGDIQKYQSIRYLIKPASPDTFALAQTVEQSIKRIDDGLWELTVRPTSWPTDATFPYRGSDPTALAALKPTQYLQSDSPEIQRQARQIVGKTTDAAVAVRMIERFVHRHIRERNLSIAWGTALEVLERREGDCSEHATLTAALCRAIGIPAQIATGYIYVDSFVGEEDIFGGHAWCMVYLKDTWYGIDATRAPDGYSAAHILVGAGDGGVVDFLPLLGGMEPFTIVDVQTTP